MGEWLIERLKDQQNEEIANELQKFFDKGTWCTELLITGMHDTDILCL